MGDTAPHMLASITGIFLAIIGLEFLYFERNRIERGSGGSRKRS
ncbi:MAG: hypothetical protein ABEJ87_02140 [Candidatus Nanohalobium sp.]